MNDVERLTARQRWCRCGHTEGDHGGNGNWCTSGTFQRCGCEKFVDDSPPPRPSISDEAEAAWEAYLATRLHLRDDMKDAMRSSFLAGFRAARPSGGSMRTLAHLLGLCPIRSRHLRRRYGQPFWREDKTAQMLGIAHSGCPICGYGATKERDRLDRATKENNRG